MPLETFYITFDQSILLVLFYTAVIFFGSLYLSLPEPELSIYGLLNVAAQTFFILLAVYIISKFTKTDNIKLSLFVVLLSIWPWFYLIWLVIGKSANFNYWEFSGSGKYLYFFYNAWMLSVIVCAVSRAITLKAKGIALTLLTAVVFVSVPLHYLTVDKFWNAADDDNEEEVEYSELNTEHIYYRQFGFMEDLKQNMLPGRENISDIYFIGFGSYASQDVFMKEVQYAKELFDERFNTKGRSVALINNVKTVEALPLASKSNLNIVIQYIGRLINPEEDILFLYLTSHGSKEHRLSVEFMPLELNAIDPYSLKESLDNSGIKYRVIVISACYSGGFVEPLKDDSTIIMTSSASNKTSFGCSNENDFTYLGQAIFDEQLKRNFDFIEAFNKAIEAIRDREKTENKKSSDPQLFVGEEIRSKLEIVSQRLKELHKIKEASSRNDPENT